MMTVVQKLGLEVQRTLEDLRALGAPSKVID